jgi:hypothetical protein
MQRHIASTPWPVLSSLCQTRCTAILYATQKTSSSL